MDEQSAEHEAREQQAGSRPGLSDDDVYRALASTQRRRALYVLLVQEDTTIAELATVLAGWEATDAGTMRGPADRRRIRTDLHHRHLPVLADAGLVEYDPEEATVAAEPLDDDLRVLVCRSIESGSAGSL